MMLIGFFWIFVAMGAALVSKFFVPGRWEDSGPAAFMTAGMGSFLASEIAILAVDGPNGYGPPLAQSTFGLISAVLGGVIGFLVYVYDARRQPNVVS